MQTEKFCRMERMRVVGSFQEFWRHLCQRHDSFHPLTYAILKWTGLWDKPPKFSKPHQRKYLLHVFLCYRAYRCSQNNLLFRYGTWAQFRFSPRLIPPFFSFCEKRQQASLIKLFFRERRQVFITVVLFILYFGLQIIFFANWIYSVEVLYPFSLGSVMMFYLSHTHIRKFWFKSLLLIWAFQ